MSNPFHLSCMRKPVNLAWAISANIGDGLNPWLVQKLTGVFPVYADSLSVDYNHYIVCGSVASAARRNSICWGPGILWGYERPDRNAQWLAVRGPLTRSAIITAGGECPDIFGDPAILLPEFIPPAKSKKYKLTIIPHYIDQMRFSAGGWVDVCVRDDIHWVNVFDTPENICREISESEKIISSTLHGCIIADTYGVPWEWIKLTDRVGGDDSKFMDYFLSMGREKLSFIDLRIKAYGADVLMDFVKKAACTDPDRMARARARLMSVCPFTKD